MSMFSLAQSATHAFGVRVGQAPLSGLAAPIPTFPFTELQDDLEQPPRRVMVQFIQAVVSRLGMSVGEVVMAHMIVEQALSNVRQGPKPQTTTRHDSSSPSPLHPPADSTRR